MARPYYSLTVANARMPRLVALVTVVALASLAPAPAGAQDPPATREALIEQAQAEKVPTLHPYVPGQAERIFERVAAILEGRTLKWHPFFESAYAGGGFTLGVGRAHYVSPYNFVDVRGSLTVSGYKRIEAEFVAPRLLDRRASLSVLGGWREATDVNFFGLGPDTSRDARTSYLFRQPYGSALFTIFPVRHTLLLRGGAELTQWSQEPGRGDEPSVETRYTAADLPGLGAEVTYLHTQATAGVDWRTSPGYSRRGGFYGVTLHDFDDVDDRFGFRLVEYEAIQHVPILRDAWVLSLRGHVQTVLDKDGQEVPFFMMPALGGGSSLRGYNSWRFRDENSLLLQAEWRVIVNRYLDVAVFYDAGKVAARRQDLGLDGLKSDAGVGVRFHGPFATPLRIELAKSRERLGFVFSSSASF